MAFDSQRINVTEVPTPIIHPDEDLQAGHSAMCQCPTADLLVGGPELDATNGYHVVAGDAFQFSSDEGTLYVMLATGVGPAELQVLWGGV